MQHPRYISIVRAAATLIGYCSTAWGQVLAAAVVIDPTQMGIWPWVALILSSIAGWGCSSLLTLATWSGGTAEEKLKVIHGLWVSQVAGGIAYFSALQVGIPTLFALFAAVGAGWGGTKFLAKHFGESGAGPDPRQP